MLTQLKVRFISIWIRVTNFYFVVFNIVLGHFLLLIIIIYYAIVYNKFDWKQNHEFFFLLFLYNGTYIFKFFN